MLKRWVIQTGIIAVGAVVAVGTLQHGSPIAKTPLVRQLAAGDSVARAKMSSLVTASSSSGATASSGGLDGGIDHPRIDYWVNRLSTTMASSFKTSLTRMEKYADMIGTKLDDKAMPQDLIYLALIESDFNPNAKSRVKAVGLWQFMKGTAKQYGLSVGKKVDERKNPKLATDAALTYLSSLHDRLGSWYLAAAAYNSGEGTVLKALKKVTGKTKGTDADFFRIMPALPKETQDYVPKLIAAARIGNDPAKYGITSGVPPSPARTIASAQSGQKAVTQ
jgi:soluble lytic murein transglycosylase-like protein